MPFFNFGSTPHASSARRTAASRSFDQIYLALGAIVVATICGGLYLNYLTTSLFSQSINVTREHSGYLAAFLELGELAQQVNAPANDIFDGRAIDAEEEKRD